MDSNFWGIIGILFASLLSSVGYLYTIRLRTKRSMRAVLYYLLEFRFAIGVSLYDKKEIEEHFWKAFENQIDIVKKDQLSQQEIKMIMSPIQDVLEEIHVDPQTFLKPYENSLSDLAEKDPFVAHKLRGKEKFQGIIEIIKNSKKNLCEYTLECNNDFIRKMLEPKNDSLHFSIILKQLQKIDEDIILIADRCGFWERKKCSKFLEKNPLLEYKVFIESIDTMNMIKTSLPEH